MSSADNDNEAMSSAAAENESDFLTAPKHEIKVMPIVLLLKVGLEGIGWEHIYDSDDEDWVQQLRFRYVGLPALEAAEYVTGSNSFAVALAGLMRRKEERNAWLKATALKRIGETEASKARRFL